MRILVLVLLVLATPLAVYAQTKEQQLEQRLMEVIRKNQEFVIKLQNKNTYELKKIIQQQQGGGIAMAKKEPKQEGQDRSNLIGIITIALGALATMVKEQK